MANFQGNPVYAEFDNSGAPLSSGLIYTYESGTSNLKTTYNDAAKTVPNTNPIVLDTRGEAVIVLGAGAYTFKVLRADQTQVRTLDGITDMVQAAADSASAAAAAASLANSVAAAASAASAATAKTAAEIARDGALLSRGIFATTAKALSKGVLSYSVVANGSAGTNGQFDIAFSGGAGTGAAGRFIVAGGVLTSVTITATGDSYTSAPTMSFAASAGLTGASATAVIGNNVDPGEYFSTPSATLGSSLDFWQNVAGVATAQKPYPSTELLAYPRPISATVGTGLLDAGVQIAGAYIATVAAASAVDGFVETISFNVTIAGYVRVFSYELISGTDYRISNILNFKTAVGLNTYVAGVDFDYFRLPVGSRIGGTVKSGGTNVMSNAAAANGSGRNFTSAASTFVGATATLQAQDNINDTRVTSLKYTIVSPATMAEKNPAKLNDLAAGRLATAADLASVRRGKKSLDRQLFPGTSTPTNWVLSTWTVNNGLVAPTTPAAATHARWDIYDNSQYGTIRARFLVTDAATSRFGIFTQNSQSIYGGAVLIDAATNAMSCYYWDGSTFQTLAVTFNKTVTIPALVSGREYMLSVKKIGLDTEIEWRDCLTGAATALTSKFSASTHDNFRGKPGVVYTAGAANGVTVKYFEAAALFDAPKIVVLGDSNSWGGSIGPTSSTFKPDEWKSAWGYLLDADRGRGDVLLAGRGGETSVTLTSLLTAHVTPWNPDFWVICIGTNDTVQATWRTNVQTVITACLARGGTPVICTIPPKGTGQTLINSLNADILADYFGAYQRIDFAAALSSSNDRVTINAAMYNSDNVHFNTVGHAAVFNQIKADAPYLLRA